ncbi:expressed unknown protein [Ectocarpus siliculosus]|uniref:Uncharacterized protein n=1 Tax=Ectocarpus siliculosus TaxID=2880 RepID=D8LH67_ECTSI|nr:expressed unknown protein [Ectocarpus siliculosus]|eukprot:CBN74286.1 expressed unknown protein [Ectocarpus siliculosus]
MALPLLAVNQISHIFRCCAQLGKAEHERPDGTERERARWKPLRREAHHLEADIETSARAEAMLPSDMEEAPEAHLMEGTPGTQLVEATRQRVQRGRRTETRARRAAVVPPEMAEAPQAHLMDENPGTQLTPARRAAVVHPEMAEATEMQLMKKARRIPSRQRGGQPTRRKVEHRRPRSQGR